MGFLTWYATSFSRFPLSCPSKAMKRRTFKRCTKITVLDRWSLEN